MEEEESKLSLAFDFRYFLNNYRLPPAVINASGFYKEKGDKIKKILKILTIEEIIKVLSVSQDINFKEIEKIIGKTHPTMWEHICNLEELKIVKKEKKKLKGERKEFKINLNENIKVSHLFVYESKTEEKKSDGNEIIEVWSTSNPKTLKEMGFKKIETIVNNKNVDKVISKYISQVEDILKSKKKPPKKVEEGEAKAINFDVKEQKASNISKP